jgi:hypothetical protein
MEVIRTLFEDLAIIMILYGFVNEPRVVRWERRQWAKFKRWLRTQLRKNPRIVAWAEKPAKHGKPDMAWIEGQVKVWGDEWR